MGFNPRIFSSIFSPRQQEEEELPDYGGFTPQGRVQGQFRNMFDSPDLFQPIAPKDRWDNPTPKPSDEFSRRFGMMAEQQGPAQSAYRDFLQTQPTREGSQPGKWDRLAAIIGGSTAGLKDPAKGIATAQYFRDRKYNESLEDFKLRGAGLKERAEEERQGMTSKRTIMNDIYKQMLDEKKARGEQDLRDAQIRNYDSQSKEREAPQASDFVRIETPTGYAYKNVQTGEQIDSSQPGMTQYQKEQIRIADENAKSNRIRADKYQPGGGGGRSGYQEYTPPQDENAASKAALDNVILRNPQWSKFREMDPNAGNWFGGAFGQAEGFDEFTAAVRKEKDRILENGRRSRRAANPGAGDDGMMDLNDILNNLPD